MDTSGLLQGAVNAARGVGTVAGNTVRWTGKAFLELAPPAVKWGSLIVIAGFFSFTVLGSVFFVSVAQNGDTVLGVLDRMQAIDQQQAEAELERIQARRSKIDAEVIGLRGEGELAYCMTTDFERLSLEDTWINQRQFGEYDFGDWD